MLQHTMVFSLDHSSEWPRRFSVDISECLHDAVVSYVVKCGHSRDAYLWDTV